MLLLRAASCLGEGLGDVLHLLVGHHRLAGRDHRDGLAAAPAGLRTEKGGKGEQRR